jgi:hypothetical protein
MPPEYVAHHLQHRRDQLGLLCQQQPQSDRLRQDPAPLANRLRLNRSECCLPACADDCYLAWVREARAYGGFVARSSWNWMSLMGRLPADTNDR